MTWNPHIFLTANMCFHALESSSHLITIIERRRRNLMGLLKNVWLVGHLLGRRCMSRLRILKLFLAKQGKNKKGCGKRNQSFGSFHIGKIYK